MRNIQLQGKVLITGEIEAITGLHIGGTSGELDIGGVDNPVLRNPLNREPYIPGSSLRGKMRSLLDRHLGNELNQRISQISLHACKTADAYRRCAVCHVFGVAPNPAFDGLMPTRLIVRDTALTEKSRKSLNKIDTDMLFTEVKTEVAIDRITSAASPRQNERVPAGTIFGPFEIVFSLYTLAADSGQEAFAREVEWFDNVLTGMELLEDDYLGGHGSRGSGKIAFRDLKIMFKSRAYYEEPQSSSPLTLAEGNDLSDLRALNYRDKILEELK